MLKLKYLIENFDLSKEVLKHFDHDEDNLDEMLSYFRISSNAVYPFTNKGELWFLRLTPEDEITRYNFFGELEFVDYLCKNSFRTNSFIMSDATQPLATTYGNYYAVAFRGVPGKQIEELDFDDDMWFRYGESLAELHLLSERYHPQTVRWSWKEALCWAERVLNENPCAESMRAELVNLREDLSFLPCSEYGLVHYDFEPDNVFFDSENCWVIDFNDVMYHWYALDIAQVFGCIDDDMEDSIKTAAKESFLSGYKSKRKISESMMESMPLMYRFINLYGYARLVHCLSEKPDIIPDWMENLIKKLEFAKNSKEIG